MPKYPMSRPDPKIRLSEKEKLDKIIKIGELLQRIQDLDILMERLLSEARRFVNADAGSIYIRKKDRLNFTYSQNDTLQKRLAPGEKLIYKTFSIPIDESTIAGHVAITGEPLNIPDVYKIDPDANYSFNPRFDMASDYRTGSMLTYPLKNIGMEIIGVLQLINAKDNEGRVVPFTRDDENLLKLFAGIAAVSLERAMMTRAIILRMIKMTQLRDPKETGAHVNRVGSYAVEIYEKWATRRAIPKSEIEKKKDVLRMAAMLHDVGKVGIPDKILKKPGKLDPEEYEKMKHHTILGAQLFLDKQSELDRISLEVVLNHHEKWNGEGYPGHVDIASGKPKPGFEMSDGRARGKKGDEIPLFGRIVALADVYDALSSARVYKEAWDEEQVISTIREESGIHFDPELVEIFLSRLDVMRAIRNRFRE